MSPSVLPEGVTLQLLLRHKDTDGSAGKVLFSSSKKWLHPLFELEEFLAENSQLKASASDLLLRDKVVGRAAAFFILRLGLRRVETDLVSRRALTLLQNNSVAIEAAETIEAIDCLTEELLKDIADPAEAAVILADRRAKALAKTK